MNLRQLAIASAGQVRPVTWRQGTKATRGNPDAAMTSRFLAIRVRPANRDIPRAADGSLPECWLLAEWPPEADEPTDYWLSTLPADTPIDELVRLAKIRWRVEHDYRELKTGLGLDHFEGRSFTGWHRHVTLAALAQAFCTMLRTDPKVACAGMTLYQVLRELQIVLALILGACPLCCQPVTLDRLAAALTPT